MRKSISLTSAVMAALHLFGACSGAGVETEFAVRDSAGIRIVESHAPAWTDSDRWRVSDEPMLSIGELEGPDEYQLFRVSGAVRLLDGSIVVGNGGTHQLRFYGPDGIFLRSVGAQGEGPGEFAALGQLQPFPGDSIGAFDFQAMRLSVFGADGGFGRVLTLPLPGVQGFPNVIGPVGERILLTSGTGPATSPVSDGQRDSLLVLLYDPDRPAPDTVARLLGAGMRLRSAGEGFTVAMSVPFEASPQLAVARDGFYVGYNESFDIGQHALDGTLRRRIRVDHPPRPVTAEHIAEHREQRLAGISDPRRRSAMEGLLADAPYPANFPAYQGLLVDSDGNLWVRDYAIRREAEQAWTVFDPEGRMLGSVRISDRSVLRQVGSDFVLLTVRDELDVEYVRLHQLSKP